MKRTVAIPLISTSSVNVEVDFPVYTKTYGSSEYRESTTYWKHTSDDWLISLSVDSEHDGSEERVELGMHRGVPYTGANDGFVSTAKEFEEAMAKFNKFGLEALSKE